jgi:hypothetical protein
MPPLRQPLIEGGKMGRRFRRCNTGKGKSQPEGFSLNGLGERNGYGSPPKK